MDKSDSNKPELVGLLICKVEAVQTLDGCERECCCRGDADVVKKVIFCPRHRRFNRPLPTSGTLTSLQFLNCQ
uniref:Uncharacterized protein n=1 Tax=Globodera rostochiensis TaxID=31243 RepID=A0A914GY55_GLORO